MIIITLITILALSIYTSYDTLLNDISDLQGDSDLLHYDILELENQIEKLTIQNKSLTDNNLKLKDDLDESLNLNKSLNLQLKKLKEKPTRGSISRTFIGIFEATAYDDSPESQGKWVGKTASGMKPQVGVIAVDPKIIPLGTKLYVEGYGKCIAGDTGGAIKGNRLDLFFNTRSEVYNWGRRKVKVYKLGE